MTMDRLKDWQSRFRDYLCYGRHEAELAAQVRDYGGASRIQRLDVYRNGYFIRLEAALAHDFPIVETVLGQRRFARAAGEYLLEHPSRSPTLRYLGHAFSTWLQANGESPIADLASIEWAVLHVFDGADASHADPSNMDALEPTDWPELEISLVPTLTILSLNSNADSVWHSRGREPLLMQGALRSIAVWRGANGPMVAELSNDVGRALSMIQDQAHIASVCHKMCEFFDSASVPDSVAQALRWALQNACVMDIRQ